MELECHKCGYKFKRPAAPQRCPYCSAEDSVTPLKTAQDLLDDVMSVDENRKSRNL